MNPALLAVLVGAVVGIVGIRRWITERREAMRRELSNLRAELHQVRNEYYRFSRDGSTDRIEHDRIVTKAQGLCRRGADLFDKDCPQECLDVPTEADADRDKFKRVDEKCRRRLLYIATKRLTQNQVTKEVNPLECDVWGEYRQRNEQAFDDATEFLDSIKI